MRSIRIATLLAGLAALSACGDTLGEQAIIGAGAGAAGAAATGGDTIAGAAIGAAGNVAYCRQNPGDC